MKYYLMNKNKELMILQQNDDFLFEDHGIQNADEKVQKMMMLDYIMLNEDRHLNNYGIIHNVDTLKWVDVCPIFDTGRSNNCNVTEKY